MLKYRDLWSSDVNIIENFCGLLAKEVYRDAKQYSLVHELKLYYFILLYFELKLILDSCAQIS